MPLHEGLELLRSALGQAADEVDAALAAWTEALPGSDASGPCETIVATLDQLAEASRLIGLEGQALAVERLRDTAQLCAMADEAEAGALLAWLTLWRLPLSEVYELPGDAEAAQNLLDYLALSPLPLPEAGSEALRTQLLRKVLPPASAGTDAAIADEPMPDAVSLEVPEDIDHELFDTFIAQAPDQLAVLAEAVQALVAGRPGGELLAEAQRVAHTFKGSGNIIGISGVGRLAHRLEDVLDFARSRGGRLPAALAQDLLDASQTLEQMIAALRGEEVAPPQALGVLRTLTAWSARIAQGQVPDEADAPAGLDRPADAQAPGPQLPASTSPSAGVAEGPAQVPRSAADPSTLLRVDAAQLEELARGAGQQVVEQGRLTETVRQIDQRLATLQTTQQTLHARITELQTLIDRRDAPRGDPDASGQPGLFHPEAGRGSELNSLVRLAAEMVADGQDLARASRADLHELQNRLTDSEQRLKQQHLRLLETRLVPFRQVAARLQRAVSRTAAATGKRAQLLLTGEDTRLERAVLERLTDALQHLLRNAIDHGIEPPEQRRRCGKPETGTLHLRVQRADGTLRIECQDDGAGLDLPAIQARARRLGLVDADAEPAPATVARWILLPGFSTRDSVSELSGRGLGLDVVAAQLRALKGQVDIATQAGEGCCFTLQVPATTGLAHALIVRSGHAVHALPARAVERALPASQVQIASGRLQAQGQSWPCRSLASLLGQTPSEAAASSGKPRPAVLVRMGRQTVALEVDAVLETRELLLQDAGRLLAAAPGVAGAALRDDGRVIFVLDLDGLQAGPDGVDAEAARSLRDRALRQRRRALVVDDSHSVRHRLMQTLADAGWEVLGAGNGFDALAQLARERVDIVLTDLEMPQLDGVAMTRELRRRAEARELPVLMITARDSARHRSRAHEAGVNRYLTKPVTDTQLLACVAELVGAARSDTATTGANANANANANA